MKPLHRLAVSDQLKRTKQPQHPQRPMSPSKTIPATQQSETVSPNQTPAPTSYHASQLFA